jgi:hypothetical protein
MTASNMASFIDLFRLTTSISQDLCIFAGLFHDLYMANISF